MQEGQQQGNWGRIDKSSECRELTRKETGASSGGLRAVKGPWQRRAGGSWRSRRRQGAAGGRR